MKGGAIMAYFTRHIRGVSSLRSHGLGRAGVMASLLLAATLVCTLALVRPVEAEVFRCETKITERCLADAITAANQNGQENTVYLGKGTYQLTKRLPEVTSPRWLIIQGMGAGLTAISGSCIEAKGKDRDSKECGLDREKGEEFPVLQVAPTGALWLLNVTIKNGQDANGAGIFNAGALMVYSSTVMSNHAHNYGGGIYNKSGWTYLQDSTVSNNVVHQGAGGGIFIEAGIVDIAYSTINGNKTWHGVGAGIANQGGLNIFNSTISGNTYTRKPLDRRPSRPNAGGILNTEDGEVWLKSVTITANTTRDYFNDHSQSSGGVYSQGKFYFANTIIAKNVAGPSPGDCLGRVITLGGNLVGTKKGSFYVPECQIVPPDSWEPSWPSRAADKIGGYELKDHIDPQFETAPRSSTPLLKDNGGTSCTHALLAGSPAIDSAWTGRPGDHPFACEKWDQRWVTRHSAVSGAGCDIGAFELRGASSPSGLGCTE